MQQHANYILPIPKKEDNPTHDTSTSTLQSAGEFVRTLDMHPTGGVLFLLIVAAIVWYLARKR